MVYARNGLRPNSRDKCDYQGLKTRPLKRDVAGVASPSTRHGAE
jgi:hypothetical protein